MSGDSGLQEQPVVFYSKEMTKAKMILLVKKGITFKQYEYLLEEENADLKEEVIVLKKIVEYYRKNTIDINDAISQE